MLNWIMQIVYASPWIPVHTVLEADYSLLTKLRQQHMRNSYILNYKLSTFT